MTEISEWVQRSSATTTDHENKNLTISSQAAKWVEVVTGKVGEIVAAIQEMKNQEGELKNKNNGF